ncbi:MAG TPA: RidA family protein [Candidatus Eisenbacteria bacterium]|nr:RidA family protein [Candidatus Eisenbacteria bacterium]
MTIQRFEPGPRLSTAVLHNGTAYLAGAVADDPTADVKGQTEQILKQIEETLAGIGSQKSKILSASVYLANIGTFSEMNAVWDAWVDKSNPPARATIEARLAAPQYLVEIVVTAAV